MTAPNWNNTEIPRDRRRHPRPTHLCPICRRPVTRTPHHRIHGHYDKAHNICPASYETYNITIETRHTT